MFENMPVLNKWTELFAAFGTWQYIIAAAAAFLFFLLTRGFFTGIIFRFLLGFAKKTRTDLDNNLLAAFQNPVKSLVIVVGVYFARLILPLKAKFTWCSVPFTVHWLSSLSPRVLPGGG